MSEEIKLKPCPFCGGRAEMYTGRTYPALSKSLCKTKADAEAYLEECRSNGVVFDFRISTRTRNIYSAKAGKYVGEKNYHAITVFMQAYIPRCLDNKCLGRTQIMFKTEEEAIEEPYAIIERHDLVNSDKITLYVPQGGVFYSNPVTS